MADDINSRLTELETRLAHHEYMAEELSEVMARQQDEIAQLNQLVRRLIGRMRELETGPTTAPQDERPPPHY